VPRDAPGDELHGVQSAVRNELAVLLRSLLAGVQPLWKLVTRRQPPDGDGNLDIHPRFGTGEDPDVPVVCSPTLRRRGYSTSADSRAREKAPDHRSRRATTGSSMSLRPPAEIARRSLPTWPTTARGTPLCSAEARTAASAFCS